MSTRTSPWPAGAPCWVDVMSPDVEAAGRFYSAVLGWEVAEPDEAHGGYVVATVDGAACGGLGPVQPGAPAAWTLYFATDDVEAATAAVVQHGGALLSPVLDVGDLGRMTVASDPSGAVLGLWQAGTFNGCQRVGEPGGLAWEDLRSTDPDAARAFYGAVLGHAFTPLEAAGPDYATFGPPGDPAPYGGTGGLMGSGGGSRWLVYLSVADADAAVRAAEAGGGTVTVPAKTTAFGRIAGLADPAGAEFWVHEGTGQPVPQREG